MKPFPPIPCIMDEEITIIFGYWVAPTGYSSIVLAYIMLRNDVVDTFVLQKHPS
jgi:hypothetical protein